MENSMIYFLFSCSFFLLISSKILVRFGNLCTNVIVNSIFVWILIYGILVPIIALPIDSPYLIYKEFYGFASIVMTVFYLIFLIFILNYENNKNFFNINIKNNAAINVALFSFFVFLLFWGNHKYQKDVYSMLFLPALMVAYCREHAKFYYYVNLVILHVAFFSLSSASGFLIDSKERMISCVIFPVAARVIFVVSGYRAKILFFAAIVFFAVSFSFYASNVVRETNAQAAQTEISDSGNDRMIANIERLAVIDGFSAAIFNEEKSSPMRPSDRYWSLVGFLGQIGPDFFRRPNHAKESIFLVGYPVSNDDVNIALTVPGHFLWSFGWVWLLPSMVIFWFAVFFLIKKSLSLDNTLSSMFYFFFLSQVPRLESVGYSYVSSLATVLILYYVIYMAKNIFGFDK